MQDIAANPRKQRIRQTPFPLRDFLNINPAHIEKLEAISIRNANQVLTAGKTPRRRQELSTRTGILNETILELVKLSDLTRIFGVKSVRARLYYDAGVDTVDKMAKWNPEKLRDMLIGFVQRGFNGIHHCPKKQNLRSRKQKDFHAQLSTE